MPRILIFDGAPARAQHTIAAHGGPTNQQMFEGALSLHVDALEAFTLNVADGERLPQGMAPGDFDGVVITGSPLNIYKDEPVVAGQIALAREIFAAGLPVWGSCWGLQLGTVALGGTVRLNPKGREVGIARTIALDEASRSHPLFAGRPAAFDALCSHQDEVETLPAGARVLASNAMSDVQAMEVAPSGKGPSFFGVQYHPEHTFAMTAAIIDSRRDLLVADGFARSPADLDNLVADLRALHTDPTRRDIAWRLGLDAQVLDARQRSAEMGRWLTTQVLPRRTARAAAA